MNRSESDGLTVLAFFAFASVMVVAGVALAAAIDSWWALASVVVVDFILVASVMWSVFALLND